MQHGTARFVRYVRRELRGTLNEKCLQRGAWQQWVLFCMYFVAVGRVGTFRLTRTRFPVAMPCSMPRPH